MSKHRRKRSSVRHRSHGVAREARPRTTPPVTESDRQAAGGAAMTLAADSCLDDRPGNTDESPDEPPGIVLRTARDARGLTIEDIARSTKIGKTTLAALEASDVLRLPAAIYTRGFVKAYAHEVGLDPDQTADEYLRRIEPFTTHHLLVDDGVLPPLSKSASESVDANDDARQLLAVNQVRRFSRLTTVAAVIGLIVYLVSFNRQADDDAEPASTLAPVSDAAPASAARTDPAAIAPGRPNDVVTALNGPLQIELTPQGPCWVVATVDGERVVARLLQPGERQTLEMSEEALLRVGDPGALAISINGRSGRSLGPPGQPVNVKITKDNFKDFLSS